MGGRAHVRKGQAAKQRRQNAAASRQESTQTKKDRLDQVVQFASEVTGDDPEYALARLLAKD